MINISKKTLQDLEFETVLTQVEAYATTELGKTAITQICPFTQEEKLKESLARTNEYLASFENENVIPSHYFESISEEIKRLSIENYFLEVESFRKIKTIAEASNDLIKFFENFQEYYPNHYQSSSKII